MTQINFKEVARRVGMLTNHDENMLYSVGAVGVTLADAESYGREIARLVAQQMSAHMSPTPAAMQGEVHPSEQNEDIVRHADHLLTEKIESVTRKLQSGSLAVTDATRTALETEWRTVSETFEQNPRLV